VRGLAALHGLGVMHHDQKLENLLVMVHKEGNVTTAPELEVVVADLGAAGVGASMDNLSNPNAM
jgi:serine/threonine protein kinase